MSEFASLKQDFQRAMAQAPSTTPPELFREILPREVAQRWAERFLRPPKQPPTGRWVNHFLVGADPEFYLFDAMQ